MSNLFPVLGIPLRGIRYLLGRFRFTTDAAAPLGTPYTEAGALGSLTLVQTDGQFSTSGGKLVYPAQATPVWGDLGAYAPTGLARVAGRAVLVAVTPAVNNATGALTGWNSAASAGIGTTDLCVYFNSGGGLNAYVGGVLDASAGVPYVASTTYTIASVLRSVGGFLLIRVGASATWTLLWVEASETTATVFPLFTNLSNSGTVDDVRVTDLGGSWTSDYGIATQRLAGARTVGDTLTHTANCLLEWVIPTLPTAAGVNLFFRQQDTSNAWYVQVVSDGSMNLSEYVAGVATTRGSVAAGTVAAGHRIVVVADGTTIRVYSNNTLRITYASAATFQTMTTARVQSLGTGGSISDVIAWPRVVSLPRVV